MRLALVVSFASVVFPAISSSQVVTPDREYIYVNGKLVVVERESSSPVLFQSINPSSATLSAGDSPQTINVTLTRTNYFGTVTLVVGQLPSGVTVSYNHPLAANSGSITLTASGAAAVVSNQAIPISLAGTGFAAVSSFFTLSVTRTEPAPTFGTLSAAGVASQVHSLAVAPDGSVYLLAPSGSSLGVWKSTNHGTTFGGPVSLPNSLFSNSEYSFAIDPSGVIHVVWWLSTQTGTETYYSRSNNGGVSFSNPIVVRTGAAFNGYSTSNAASPVVAADGTGNVYVAYGAFTKDPANNFIGYDVWVSRSTNGGSSFQPEFFLAPPTSAQRMPIRIYCNLTSFYVLSRDDTNHDLYFHSGSSTMVQSNTTRINPTQGKFLYVADLAIDSAGQNLYAAFADTTTDPEGDIVVCRSNNGGGSWGNCVRVNDNSFRTQEGPSIALDSKGVLHVVWDDLRSNSKYQLYYSRSTDGGNSFSANTNLTADQPGNNFTQGHIIFDRANMLLYASASRDFQQIVVGRALIPGVGQATPNANVGVFRSGFYWLQDVDGNRQFTAPPDAAFAFGGVPGDMPIFGDWNGNGHTKVGVYRPANGLFLLDYDGDRQFTAADKAYSLGVGFQAGDVPVVGDWNGDGKTKVGLFRQGFFWILDSNGNGVFEQGVDNTYAFGGVAGDIPVVGDWSGTGVSKIGLFRLSFYWILDVNGNGTLDNINGSGGDQAFAYGGIAGDMPVVGDWNGSGTSKVGVFRQGFFWVLDANGNRTFDGTGSGQDLAFPFGGITGDVPVVGKW